MKDHIKFSGSPTAGFLASLWTQVLVALHVGLPSEEEAQRGDDLRSDDGPLPEHVSIRSMDDYAGYLTSNGLGSLDVGGGGSRWDE
jgi:hypothetical protein